MYQNMSNYIVFLTRLTIVPMNLIKKHTTFYVWRACWTISINVRHESYVRGGWNEIRTRNIEKLKTFP